MKKMQTKNATTVSFDLSNDLFRWLKRQRAEKDLQMRYLVEKALRELKTRMERKTV